MRICKLNSTVTVLGLRLDDILNKLDLRIHKSGDFVGQLSNYHHEHNRH